MRHRSVLFLVFVFVFTTASICAQTFRGGITGSVTDSSGAVIADATVTATNIGTGLKRSVQTDDSGNFSFNELPLGDYEVSASKSGFKTQTMKGTSVAVAVSQRVDIQLGAGESSQVVEVTAEFPLVDSTGNTLGGTIPAREFKNTPINGRDFTKALTMVPGSTSDPSSVSDSPGSFGLFSINGNRGRSNNYLIDGTDMNDGYRNLPSINEAGVFGTPATILPLDAVAEMGILSNVEAQYGRSSGGTVNIVTKSGTNEFHGTVFEYFRNSALDARNYFNTKPAPQNAFHNNQFGGSLGGPIVKGKTFFFAAYEGQRESVGLPSQARVPTNAEIAASTAANGGVVNPVIAGILATDPWPDSTVGDIQVSTRGSNRVDSVIGKIDQQIGNNLLTARYFFGDSDQSFPLALLGGNVLPGFNTITPTTVNVLSASYTHFLVPNLISESRFGYNRFFETFFPEDSDFNPSSIGLNTGVSSRDFGLPLIRVSGFAPIGANASLPRGRTDINWQFFQNFSYTTGKHNWKAGYEFRRTTVDGFFDAGYRGVLNFDSLDDFIAGNVSGGRQARGDSDRQTFQNSHGLYLQDNWKATPKLTLNYGLRWDYFGVIGEKQNRLSTLIPAVGLVQVGSSGLDSLYPKDFNNFAPRFGFAYDSTGKGKTIVRGGWGLYYDSYSQDFFVGQLPFNTFNPGPAYNGGGPDPVEFSFSTTGTLNPGSPVYNGFSDSDAFVVDQRLRTPYVHNYNFNIQQQIGSAAIQVGYVGSQGRKLYRYRDINQQTNPLTGARPLDALTTPGGNTFFYVNQFESTANSNYNSLQSSLALRNWRGFTTRFNYTWSHSIDNASDGQDYVAQATQPDNSFNPGAERADSNFDSRHRFVWIYNYELPNPQTAKWITNGWALDGVLTIMSGMPFNVTYLFEDDYNGSGEFFGRPDLVGDPFAGTSTPNALLNLSAFAVPCTYDNVAGTCAGGQHFGNLGRNAFVGPGYRNFDFAISKNTRFGEKVNMNLRMDVFNIFNHPNFANPVLPDFGVDFLQNGIDATGRGIGFLGSTATPDVAIGNPFLGGGGSRNIQFSLKFSF
ncbi:MAG TPA: TonB-dependent receptor [Terriglobales bacterium]|nr:TonB-dependent receptor [Terriglobales bacterium]